MKPPPFTYHAPSRLDEAAAMLSELEEALPLAGGQSLIPLLNLRLAHPRHLVDLGRIPELRGTQTGEGELSVGAMTTHRALEREMEGRLPLLAEAVRHVGFPAIRTRGTLGGSLAHADPAGELPLVSLVLDAQIRLFSRRGERTVAAADFFRGHYTTAREADELVTLVVYPDRPRAWGFAEFARRTGDYAVVAAAVALTLEGGVVSRARVGLAGIAGRPLLSPTTESALVGLPLSEVRPDQAGEAAGSEVDPLPDIHGSTEYRRRLVRVLTRRAVEQATRSMAHA